MNSVLGQINLNNASFPYHKSFRYKAISVLLARTHNSCIFFFGKHSFIVFYLRTRSIIIAYSLVELNCLRLIDIQF